MNARVVRVFRNTAKQIFREPEYSCVVLKGKLWSSLPGDIATERFYAYVYVFGHRDENPECAWWDCYPQSDMRNEMRVMSLLLAAEMARTGDL